MRQPRRSNLPTASEILQLTGCICLAWAGVIAMADLALSLAERGFLLRSILLGALLLAAWTAIGLSGQVLHLIVGSRGRPGRP